ARILAIIAPIEGKGFGLFCSDKEYCIPWACIVKIGDDIILVDVKTDEILRNVT
ncbi:MAG: PRC-barrel domain-containing protein, partial [Tyzzerella sp.]|nr:PRC-barrel domain-containing protein [Candidatus Fimicola merdigallinarum]